MNKIKFLRESLRNIKTVGTVTRSSKFLCEGMVKHVDFGSAKILVELGAGDGVITHHILKNMRPDCKLLAFEVNPKFCEHLRKINDPRLVIVEDSAEKVGEYLAAHGFQQADAVISAIPFVALPEELSNKIVDSCKQHLKTGGFFIQVHYSLLLKKMYEKIFGNVATHFVAFNIPPAWVMVSTKH